MYWFAAELPGGTTAAVAMAGRPRAAMMIAAIKALVLSAFVAIRKENRMRVDRLAIRPG